MAKRRTKLAKNRAARKAQREKQMMNPGEKSNYARKARWLASHGLWGWEVHDKPWRKV